MLEISEISNLEMPAWSRTQSEPTKDGTIALREWNHV